MSFSVVILAGGAGTRMRGETPVIKGLVKVGEQPILWHIMKFYAAYGYRHFILTLGYGEREIKRYFWEYQTLSRDFTVRLGDTPQIDYHAGLPEEWRVTLVDTGLNTNKAGRVYRARDYVEGDRFAVTYGDGLSDVDLDDLLAFHKAHGRLATCTVIRPQSQYGVFHVEDGGVPVGFEEKPGLDFWINGGFMIFEREVLEYMAGGDDADLEREVLTALIDEDQLRLYQHRGFWKSMDTFKDVQQVEELWQTTQPWKVW